MHAPNAPPCPPTLEPIVLQGHVVTLAPLGRQHGDDLRAAALAAPEIWEWLPLRVRSAADFGAWLESALASREGGLCLPFAVIDRTTGRAVGSTRLMDYRPADRGIEIGHTWYARSAWASAVNPECKLLLMRHAFQTLGCVRVQLKTDERNARSRAAILRLGAQPEGTLRKHTLTQDGTYIRDSVYFSVLDDEWPAVKAGLEARLSGQ